jgi:hypothetical protein
MPVNDYTGNYTATLEGGATVTDDELVAGEPGAVVLDGTDGRVSTSLSTRRNPITNPYAGAAVGTGSWTQSGLETFATVTLGESGRPAPSSELSALGIGTAFRVVESTATVLARASHPISVVSGEERTFSAWLYTVSGNGLRLEVRDPGNALKHFGSYHTTAGWSRITLTFTPDATATWDVQIRANGNTETYFTGVLVDRGSSAGDFFPTPAQLTLGHAAWTGTAHGSASTFGAFVNSSPRTFVGVARRDSSTNAHTLFGSSDATTTPICRLNAGANTISFFPDRLTSGVTTDPIPAVAVGQTFLWGVTFNESTDDVLIYVNGSRVGTLTTASTWNTTAGTFRIGRRGATEPFHGAMGPVGVFSRALTDAQHMTLARAGGFA